MASLSREKWKPKTSLWWCITVLIMDLATRWPHALGLRCFCNEGHCPHGPSNGSCEAKPGAWCFAAVEAVVDHNTNAVVPERSYGCLPPDESSLMQCQGSLVPHQNPTTISCCGSGDLCNKELEPMYKTSPHLHHDDEDLGVGSSADGTNNIMGVNHTTSVALLVSLTTCMVILVLFVAFLYLRYKKREDFRQLKYMAARQDPESMLQLHGGTLSDLIDQSSGSGSGLPLLVQRTIAKQIQMVQPVGKGRYGEVWLAKWRGESVAVKVFFTTEETSWFRETEIYQTVLLRHDNVLGFIAADIRGTGTCTQMLLITDFHQNGSLFDFLRHNTLDEERMLTLAQTAAAGLSHLHTEIRGTKGKPMMAHRDIKSRNILVKKDFTSAIADFGLAVRYDSDTKQIDVGAPNTRVGTHRYMAPEVLNDTLNKNVFEAFLQADIYSFGLVLWELARRTLSGDKTVQCEGCELPYCEYVSADPTLEDMRALVAVKNVRPNLAERWLNHDVLNPLSKLMCECWHFNPCVRPSALRVKKSIYKLMDNSVDLIK